MEKDCAPYKSWKWTGNGCRQRRPAQWAIIYSPASFSLSLFLSLSLSLSLSLPSDCMIYLSLFSLSFLFHSFVVSCLRDSVVIPLWSKSSNYAEQNLVELCSDYHYDYKDFGFSLELSSITHSAQEIGRSGRENGRRERPCCCTNAQSVKAHSQSMRIDHFVSKHHNVQKRPLYS
jgi:hypothetical protein